MQRDLDDSLHHEHSPGSRDKAERLSSRPNQREPEMADQRNVYNLRDKRYRLNECEAHLLVEVGKFHTIEKGDLLRHIYKEDQKSFDRDLTHVHRQNLVRIVGSKGSLTKYVVLTNPAKQLAEKYFRSSERQEIYAGAVKIREMKHDAALFRLYQKAAGDIEKHGGRVARVVLDYELKREINKRRRKIKDLSQTLQEQRLKEIAEQQHLKLVNSKIPLPDLRIEYEDAQGDLCHCDLEYVTEDYRAASMAEKRAAGFQFYKDDPHGRKPYGPDLIGGLISL